MSEDMHQATCNNNHFKCHCPILIDQFTLCRLMLLTYPPMESYANIICARGCITYVLDVFASKVLI